MVILSNEDDYAFARANAQISIRSDDYIPALSAISEAAAESYQDICLVDGGGNDVHGLGNHAHVIIWDKWVVFLASNAINDSHDASSRLPFRLFS